MFKKVSGLMYDFGRKVERISDRLDSIDHMISDVRGDLHLRRQLFGVRKEYPCQYEFLMKNEIAIEEFDSFRYLRCMWLMTGEEYYKKHASECHEKLLDMYGNHSVNFCEMADAIGYEIKLSERSEVQIRTRIGLNGYQFGWYVNLDDE